MYAQRYFDEGSLTPYRSELPARIRDYASNLYKPAKRVLRSPYQMGTLLGALGAAAAMGPFGLLAILVGAGIGAGVAGGIGSGYYLLWGRDLPETDKNGNKRILKGKSLGKYFFPQTKQIK